MIIIPMAGLSRRFTNAGYDLPKYMLTLHGRTVFAHAVSSFKSYFSNTTFLFIARSVNETEKFIFEECKNLGLAKFDIAIIDYETAGQAETVEIGLNQKQNDNTQPITIFNIDTFHRNFSYPQEDWFSQSDGYLEVFRGSGANWSYVGANPSECEPLVARTTEKQPISNLCCNGLYHFKERGAFLRAIEIERRNPSAPELYVAPLYNHLIAEGGRIHYKIVPPEEIVFCGVPSEYEALLAEPFQSAGEPCA